MKGDKSRILTLSIERMRRLFRGGELPNVRAGVSLSGYEKSSGWQGPWKRSDLPSLSEGLQVQFVGGR